MRIKWNFFKKNLQFIFLSTSFLCSSSFHTLTHEHNLVSLLKESNVDTHHSDSVLEKESKPSTSSVNSNISSSKPISYETNLPPDAIIPERLSHNEDANNKALDSSASQEIFLEDVSVHPEIILSSHTSQPSSMVEQEAHRLPSHAINETPIHYPPQDTPNPSEDQSFNPLLNQSPTESVSESKPIEVNETLTLSANKSSDQNLIAVKEDHEFKIASAEGINKISFLNVYHSSKSQDNYYPFLQNGLTPTIEFKSEYSNFKKNSASSFAKITLAKNQEKRFYYTIGGARIQWASWSSN